MAQARETTHNFFLTIHNLKCGCYQGSNPGPLAHAQCYNQLMGNQTFHFSSVFITVKGYCYATISLSTDQWKYYFFKDFFLSMDYFYSANYTCHSS